MNKYLVSLISSLLGAIPAQAQESLQTQYEWMVRNPAKFTNQTVYAMSRNGNQIVSAEGVLFNLNAPVTSLTTGAVTAEFTVPGNNLVKTAKSIHFKIHGTTAANANTKTVNFVFGTTTIALLNAASNAKDFYADIVVTRTGTSTQQISVAGYANNALLNGLSVTSAQTETAAITMGVSLGTATAASDVSLDCLRVEAESGN